MTLPRPLKKPMATDDDRRRRREGRRRRGLRRRRGRRRPGRLRRRGRRLRRPRPLLRRPLPVAAGQKRPLQRPPRNRAAATGEEEIPYIDDPVSKIWVGVIVAVFLLILPYGLLFGSAGLLRAHLRRRWSQCRQIPPCQASCAAPSTSPSITIVPSAASELRAESGSFVPYQAGRLRQPPSAPASAAPSWIVGRRRRNRAAGGVRNP